MNKLTLKSEIEFEDLGSVLQLYWDNDVVSLTKEDAKALIEILQDWICTGY